MSLIIDGRHVVWRIRERMSTAGIKSASELHRRLKRVDAQSVNFAQFARFVDEPPARINLRTLLGVAVVLDCGIGDLVGVSPAVINERRK